MRKTALGLALLTAFVSGPALAWVPKLETQSAKTIIDSAYGRRAAAPTFYMLDLTVDGGKFKAPDGTVKVYDGGDSCLKDWLAAPSDYSKGSHVSTLTLSGQADQLLFQAQDARDNFKNMTPANALNAFGAGFLPDASNDYGADMNKMNGAKKDDGSVKVTIDSKTTTQSGNSTTTSSTSTTGTVKTEPSNVPSALPSLPDGQLRIDIGVKGLGDLQQRSAYLVRMKGPDGKLLAPTRFSFVNDWKAVEGGKQAGTLVYYFEPLKAGLNANDKVDLLLRNEEGSCAYDFVLDLSKFN